MLQKMLNTIETVAVGSSPGEMAEHRDELKIALRLFLHFGRGSDIHEKQKDVPRMISIASPRTKRIDECFH
jgi:hypothetical protein